MDLNNIPIEQLLTVVNTELKKQSNISKVCTKLGIKKERLRERMKKEGYVYNTEIHRYIKKDVEEVTEPFKEVIEPLETKEVLDVTINNTSSITSLLEPLGDVKAIESIKYLVDNIGAIQRLIEGINNNNTSSITSSNNNKIQLSSKETVVTSLRINKELYGMVKDRSKKNNISIGDIVNRALLDYLNNYL